MTAAWAAVPAGRRRRWGPGCRQWQEGTGQQQVSAAQPVECGAAPVKSGLRAVRCGLAAGAVAGTQAGILDCCCPEQSSAERNAQLHRNLLASNGAANFPWGGSCGLASSINADKTGFSLKSGGAGQDSHGQHPLLGFQ